jgi:hypothetical protein
MKGCASTSNHQHSSQSNAKGKRRPSGAYSRTVGEDDVSLKEEKDGGFL